MLSPNGRFETGVKICLSISSHHPEHWQPSWSVRTALTALTAFFPTPGNGAIGSLVRCAACYPDSSLAKTLKCPKTGRVVPEVLSTWWQGSKHQYVKVSQKGPLWPQQQAGCPAKGMTGNRSSSASVTFHCSVQLLQRICCVD